MSAGWLVCWWVMLLLHESALTLLLSCKNDLEHTLAINHMVQFQMNGSVPNLALTPGTFMYLNAVITSGRLYKYTPLRPIPATQY